MNSSILLLFAIGLLVLVMGGQGMVCTQWVSMGTTLVFNKPGTCYGPEIHVSGNNWRLCCDRFGTRQLQVATHSVIEPLLPTSVQDRSLVKCTRWMTSTTTSRIALAENACEASLHAQFIDGSLCAMTCVISLV
ncbi:unnamed protein product [Adineta ricciae]|uniref:Secreted protein n=1 Tax=Adineta ricciae TaxID=249248 RepID=A0A815MTK5_ADIRI|nr:unnamed protein product [Adineta ricciae]CAF1422690.1 unnamed protein product [Adineta ricciae]